MEKDIVVRIEELMDLFDDDEVTTADKIERPQSALDRDAIKDFNIRNPKAGGGRIGLKRGQGDYAGNRDNLISNLKSAIAQAEKTNNYNLLKLARRDTGGILSDRTAFLLNKASENKNFAKNFAKELNISTKKLESVLDKRAAAIRDYGRIASQKSSLIRVDPLKIKMINLIDQGINNTSELAKKLKISVAKVNQIGNALYKDIYASSQAIGKGATRETGGGLATFLPDNAKDLNSLLKKLHNVDGLETVEQRQIKKILGEAFGDGKNPELFKLYNNKINEYYDIKKKLTGKINLNLDHPLSIQMIKNLKLGKEAELFVEPLTAEINQGTKSLLDKTYAQAFASKSPDRTAKMKNVVNLAKKLELPMGTTKIISEPFYKQNIGQKIIDAAKTQNRVLKNIKNIPKEDILKVFPDKRSKLINPDVKPIDVKGLAAFMKKLGIKCQLANGINCNMPQAYEKSLNQLSKASYAGDSAAAAKMTNFAKSVRGAGSIVKGVLGPAALAWEVGIGVPLGLFEYAQGKPTDEIVNTLTYGLAGKDRETKIKEIFPEYGQGDALDTTYKGFLSTLNKLGEIRDPESLRPGKQITMEDVMKKAQPFERINPQLDTGKFFDLDMFRKNIDESRAVEQKLAEEDLQRKQQRTTDPFTAYNEDFMAAGGGIVKIAGVDSGPPPESGPMSQGLQGLMKRVKKQ